MICRNIPVAFSQSNTEVILFKFINSFSYKNVATWFKRNIRELGCQLVEGCREVSFLENFKKNAALRFKLVATCSIFRIGLLHEPDL